MRPIANPALGQSWHPAARHPRHLRERLTSRSHQELSEGFRIQSSNSEWPVLCRSWFTASGASIGCELAEPGIQF